MGRGEKHLSTYVHDNKSLSPGKFEWSFKSMAPRRFE